MVTSHAKNAQSYSARWTGIGGIGAVVHAPQSVHTTRSRSMTRQRT